MISSETEHFSQVGGRAAATPVLCLPEVGFVRLPTVLSVFPISASAWWQGIKDGRYPRGVKLSSRTTAWRAEDIRALINSLS